MAAAHPLDMVMLLCNFILIDLVAYDEKLGMIQGVVDSENIWKSAPCGILGDTYSQWWSYQSDARATV